MRFKAKLAAEQVQVLFSVIAPMSRLSSSSGGGAGEGSLLSGGMNGGTVVHLDRQQIHFSTRNTEGEGTACFAQLATKDGIFLEHRIDSQADNVICFELDLAQLKVALQNILGKNDRRTMDKDNNHGGGLSGTMTMKLAKRNSGLPCLCLDASCVGGSIELHHAIPVRIMRVADMEYHLPPKINMPDVQLELPADKPLRTIVERLKSISPHIYIEGSMTGKLALRIDGDGASISTYCNKLIPRFEDCKGTENGTETSTCTLKVDSKKLLSCLQWQAHLVGRAISSAVLCLVENEMLVLHVMLNPGKLGFFTYYVPVHFLSPDQLD